MKMRLLPHNYISYLVATLFVSVCVLGAWFVTHHEYRQIAGQWRKQLQMTADEQARQTETWLQRQYDTLVTLSENPSLHIYFTQLNSSTDDHQTAAQKEYLSNLLTFTSNDLGLQTINGPMPQGNAIAAQGGIILLDNNGGIVASSRGMPNIEEGLANRIRNAARGEVSFFDIEKAPEGNLRLGFLVPVYGTQTDPSPDTQVGYLFSAIPVNNTFLNLLMPPATAPENIEIFLARQHEDGIQYILPETTSLSENVLMTSRPVAGTPWLMVSQVSEQAALAETIHWQRIVIVATALISLALSAAGYTIWAKANAKQGVRLKSMNKIITLLSSLVDQRDPHASQHSEMVATISKAIAEQMSLDLRMCETTEMAAKLMNIGKAHISKELLTRASSLNTQELFTIRNSLVESADILEGIILDGPVVETLKQTQERVDGSGPQALKGSHILISARIISAVNAFIAMVSPRAYREPMPFEDAISVLEDDSGSRFDPAVVAALKQYIRGNGGMVLENMQRPKKQVA